MNRDEITVTLPINDFEELEAQAKAGAGAGAESDESFKMFIKYVAGILSNGNMMMGVPTIESLLENFSRNHPKQAIDVANYLKEQSK